MYICLGNRIEIFKNLSEMGKIKLSEASSYVFFTKESMYILSSSLSAEISFDKQNILNISDKVMSALLLNKSKELNIDISNPIIILSDEYYQCRSSVKAYIKKKMDLRI